MKNFFSKKHNIVWLSSIAIVLILTVLTIVIANSTALRNNLDWHFNKRVSVDEGTSIVISGLTDTKKHTMKVGKDEYTAYIATGSHTYGSMTLWVVIKSENDQIIDVVAEEVKENTNNEDFINQTKVFIEKQLHNVAFSNLASLGTYIITGSSTKYSNEAAKNIAMKVAELHFNGPSYASLIFGEGSTRELDAKFTPEVDGENTITEKYIFRNATGTQVGKSYIVKGHGIYRGTTAGNAVVEVVFENSGLIKDIRVITQTLATSDTTDATVFYEHSGEEYLEAVEEWLVSFKGGTLEDGLALSLSTGATNSKNVIKDALELLIVALENEATFATTLFGAGATRNHDDSFVALTDGNMAITEKYIFNDVTDAKVGTSFIVKGYGEYAEPDTEMAVIEVVFGSDGLIKVIRIVTKDVAENENEDGTIYYKHTMESDFIEPLEEYLSSMLGKTLENALLSPNVAGSTNSQNAIKAALILLQSIIEGGL